MKKEKPIRILTSDNKLTDEEKEQLKKEFEEDKITTFVRFTKHKLNYIKIENK